MWMNGFMTQATVSSGKLCRGREEHALVGLLTGGLAAGDEQLEVGLGLHRGHALAEDVELVVRVLVPGPAEVAGDLVRR